MYLIQLYLHDVTEEPPPTGPSLGDLLTNYCLKHSPRHNILNVDLTHTHNTMELLSLIFGHCNSLQLI